MINSFSFKKFLPLLLVVGLCVLAAAFWMKFYSPHEAIHKFALTEVKPAKKAPPFELLSIDGITEFTLENLNGKPTLVNFWATWCPPCRAELPAMNRAWAKLKDHDVNMYAVNFSDDQAAIDAFLKDYPIDFEVLMDPDGSMAQAWGMKGLPTTYLINRQGEIVYSAMGERKWDDDNIIDLIKRL